MSYKDMYCHTSSNLRLVIDMKITTTIFVESWPCDKYDHMTETDSKIIMIFIGIFIGTETFVTQLVYERSRTHANLTV
jgi:hypothetical protein